MESNGVRGRRQVGQEPGCDLRIEIDVVLTVVTVAVIEQEK